MNLLHSSGFWFFDIWHLFDNLTSFDILTHCYPIALFPSRSMHYYVNVPNHPLFHYSYAQSPMETAQGDGVYGQWGMLTSCNFFWLWLWFVFGYNGLHRSWWCCCSCIVIQIYIGTGWWETWAMGYIAIIMHRSKQGQSDGAHEWQGTWVIGTWVMGHNPIIMHRSRWGEGW